MSNRQFDGACLVFRGSRDNPLGSTFYVGSRRFRVVREFSEWGQRAVIARPCKWYDGLDVAAGWLARMARQPLARSARKSAGRLRLVVQP